LSDEERIEAEEKARAEKIELVGEVFYMDGQKDFGAELKELFKLKVEEKMVGRRLIREYTQEADIEALFIPDYYDAVAQIAPSLAYYNLQDMFLMGSNGWNSPKLLKLTKKHVEGAIFVDGFFKGSQTPAANEFIEKFRAAYGYTPGIVEAQAFDATRIILKAVERAGSGERKYVRQAIEDTFDFEGATGVISFDEHGEAKKDVTLLTVSKGKIKELFMDEKISVKSRITPDDEPQ
ncbi:MAG: ABC transporter substrate-binding protein, partial [Deltaproteobacteria bacterium]|nr:ABC transporter substrate-binding protein [Deltaproteobacteria bacterium]